MDVVCHFDVSSVISCDFFRTQDFSLIICIYSVRYSLNNYTKMVTMHLLTANRTSCFPRTKKKVAGKLSASQRPLSGPPGNTWIFNKTSDKVTLLHKIIYSLMTLQKIYK